MNKRIWNIFVVLISILSYPPIYCRIGVGNLNCECGYFKNDFDVLKKLMIKTVMKICSHRNTRLARQIKKRLLKRRY